jgi:hypothetical protein
MGLTVILSVGATTVIAYALKAVLGLRPTPDAEEEGLDEADHGEAGYHPEEAGYRNEDLDQLREVPARASLKAVAKSRM